jgi:hypothetical protein
LWEIEAIRLGNLDDLQFGDLFSLGQEAATDVDGLTAVWGGVDDLF